MDNLKSLCEKVLEDSDEADSIYDKRVIRLVKAVIVLTDALEVIENNPGWKEDEKEFARRALAKANEIARGE